MKNRKKEEIECKTRRSCGMKEGFSVGIEEVRAELEKLKTKPMKIENVSVKSLTVELEYYHRRCQSSQSIWNKLVTTNYATTRREVGRSCY